MDFCPDTFTASLRRDIASQQLTERQKIAFRSLSDSLFKKYLPSDEPTQPQKIEAESAFVAANKRCLSYSLPTCKLGKDLINRVRFKLWTWLGDYWWTDNFSSAWDIGPGASRGSKYNDWYTKLYASKLTGTSPVFYRMYQLSQDGWACKIAAIHQEAALGYSRVKGSLASHVPKNYKTSRLICTEPTLNMMAQKAIGSYIEDRLLSEVGIDLSRQPSINRRLARAGSLYKNFCTIDLKSASDTISLTLCKAVLPDRFFRSLLLARSPVTRLPEMDKTVKLAMISSMGNGFTFPLQTMIFSAIVQAVYDMNGLRYRVRGAKRFAVFGDDIICADGLYNEVVKALELCGFVVNLEKSFHGSDEHFRESCGGDYVNGYDVRGVYLKDLRENALRYSAFNRIRGWGQRHSVSVFNMLLHLRRTVPSRAHCHYAPFGSQETEGLWATRGQLKAPAAARNRLQHDGTTVGSRSMNIRVLPDVLSIVTFPVLRSQTPVIRVEPKDIKNPSGALAAAVSGRQPIIGKCLGLVPKHHTVVWSTVRRATSVWPSSWVRVDPECPFETLTALGLVRKPSGRKVAGWSS